MGLAFQPITIGGMELKNRFVHSATHEAMADANGRVTDDIIRRYETLAKGEIGLIIPGHLFVHPRGQAHHGQCGIHDDGMIPELKKLAEAVHRHGGKIAFQLAHGGRQSPKALIKRRPLAPSGHGLDPVSLNRPKAMSVAEIRETAGAFVRSAERAMEAGADAVQLHCSHGYLLNEFLSPFFNRRRDEYGGSDENRSRFLEEVVAAVTSILPADKPLLVKLNTNDFTPRQGVTPELAAVYAGRLVKMGVAAVEVSCGTYYGFQTIRGEVPVTELASALPAWMRPVARIKMKLQAPANRFQEAYNLEAAKVVKKAMNGAPLILVGGMRRLDHMEDVLETGHADLLAMSRPFIREPLLVKHFRQGKTGAAACISCNKCFAAMFNRMPVRCYHKGLPIGKSGG
ncbi:MAG: NADH:flavin oxidoreductase [Thermodesulfobacteriota bacterium]